jgi:coenzyme F420-0:L-glutamate ligase/coenzyme F420-1:gamma-L-glutamate ligase
MPQPEGMQIFAISGLGEVSPGTDLAALIAGAVAPAHPDGPELAPGDVVVVTQKIVSKAEGQRPGGQAGIGAPGVGTGPAAAW